MTKLYVEQLWLHKVVLIILEGTAGYVGYAGLLLAPAEGLDWGSFCVKKSFSRCLCLLKAIFGVQL